MNEATEMELEIVELGDAKDETKGSPGPLTEQHPTILTRKV